MPLCGFNQEMLSGLDSLHKGLVEHGILHRSKIKSQTVEQTTHNELSDMDRFLKETHNISDPEMRAVTEALTKYAYAFYNLIQKEGIAKYPKIIQFLNKFYLEMDDKYYSELEGKPDDMKKLAIHLNTLTRSK